MPPGAQLLFAFTQQWTDKALKSLRKSGVGDIALVLVKLSECKKTTRRNQRFVEFIDDGGLADSGIPGNQHQLRPAAGHHTIKRRQQSLNLARSPVQFLRDEQ